MRKVHGITGEKLTLNLFFRFRNPHFNWAMDQGLCSAGPERPPYRSPRAESGAFLRRGVAFRRVAERLRRLRGDCGEVGWLIPFPSRMGSRNSRTRR